MQSAEEKLNSGWFNEVRVEIYNPSPSGFFCKQHVTLIDKKWCNCFLAAIEIIYGKFLSSQQYDNQLSNITYIKTRVA